MTMACALPGIADAPVGAPGTVIGVTLTGGVDAALAPAILLAITVHVTETPLVSPDTTIGDAAPLLLAAPQVAVKPVIMLPPFDAGTVNSTDADPSPAIAVTPVGASGTVIKLKVGVTVWNAFIVTTHKPVPLQPAPDHPAKNEPPLADALNVTIEPALKFAAQVAPQLMLAGFEPTLPLPVPAGVTVKVGAAIFNVSAADPVPLTLEALIIATNDPLPVGFPLMMPVIVFTANPDGRPLAENDMGPLLAVIEYENDANA